MIKQLVKILCILHLSIFAITHEEAIKICNDKIDDLFFDSEIDSLTAFQIYQEFEKQVNTQIECNNPECIYCFPFIDNSLTCLEQEKNTSTQSSLSEAHDYTLHEQYQIPTKEELSSIVSLIKLPQECTNEIDSFMMRYLLNSCPQKLLENIELLRQADLNDKLSSTTLLKKALIVGPPGSGKTTLGKAIAVQLNRPYIYLRATDFFNEYKDSGIANISRIFNSLMRYKFPVVIQIDEITALTDRFENKNNPDQGVVEHFWTTLDACMAHPHILILCTCNTTKKIPMTIRNRFPGLEFYIGLPCKSVRKKMLWYYIPETNHFDPLFFNEFLKKTEGFSYRELQEVIHASLNAAQIKKIKTKSSNLETSKEQILSSLKQVLTTHTHSIEEQQCTDTQNNIQAFILSAGMPIITSFLGFAFQYWLAQKQMIQGEKFHTEQLNQTKALHAKDEKKCTSDGWLVTGKNAGYYVLSKGVEVCLAVLTAYIISKLPIPEPKKNETK